MAIQNNRMFTQNRSVAYLKRTIRQLDYRIHVLESYMSSEGCGLRIPVSSVNGSVDILVKAKTVRITITNLWGGGVFHRFMCKNRSRILKEISTGVLGILSYEIDRSELLFVARLAVAARVGQLV
jgi:hypothetical protein